MAPMRRFGIVDFMLFVYVLAVAGGVRAGYLGLAPTTPATPARSSCRMRPPNKI